jgi:hypothetical protein
LRTHREDRGKVEAERCRSFAPNIAPERVSQLAPEPNPEAVERAHQVNRGPEEIPAYEALERLLKRTAELERANQADRCHLVEAQPEGLTEEGVKEGFGVGELDAHRSGRRRCRCVLPEFVPPFS